MGVDPEGSILAQPDSMNDRGRLEPYQVEGIGYDFVPNVLDRSLVDRWIKCNDSDSLVMMRKLIREEGLLCGGSCGAAASCALKAAESLGEGQRCVIIMPDSVRNYMTKALSDEWMVDHNFVDNDVIKPKSYGAAWWTRGRVCDLPLAAPLTITSDVACRDAIALLKAEGYDMVPVIGTEGEVIGVVTEGNMSSKIISGRADPDATVADAGVVYKAFRRFNVNDSLSDLARALDLEPYALIVTEQRCFRRSGGVVTKSVVSGIVTRIDLLEYVSSNTGTRMGETVAAGIVVVAEADAGTTTATATATAETVAAGIVVVAKADAGTTTATAMGPLIAAALTAIPTNPF